MTKNKLLVLVMGNTGTGKSAFLTKLNVRERRKIIKTDDYPDINNGDFSIDIFTALKNDKIVLLEGNYMSRSIRSRMINPIRNYIQNMIFICFDFGPGNSNTLKNRLLNTSLSEKKVIEVHNRYKSVYEKPIFNEGFLRIFKCYN